MPTHAPDDLQTCAPRRCALGSTQAQPLASGCRHSDIQTGDGRFRCATGPTAPISVLGSAMCTISLPRKQHSELPPPGTPLVSTREGSRHPRSHIRTYTQRISTAHPAAACPRTRRSRDTPYAACPAIERTVRGVPESSTDRARGGSALAPRSYIQCTAHTAAPLATCSPFSLSARRARRARASTWTEDARMGKVAS